MTVLTEQATPAVLNIAELPEYATRPQVAAFTQTSIPTLARWAMEGTGPKVTRIGKRAVRYRREDVASWLESIAS